MFSRFESFYCNQNISCTTDIERQAPDLLLRDPSFGQDLVKLTREQPFRQFLEHPLRDLDFGLRELAPLGWKILSPSAFAYRDLKWIIKTNYADGENGKQVGNVAAGKFENLQRPLMGAILRGGAEEAHLDLAVPREYLVPIPDPTGVDLRNRFFVISEKIDLSENQLDGWKVLHEKNLLQETVRKICHFIIVTGYADASLSNICFTKDGKLSVIDTEGIGLLKDVRELSAQDKNNDALTRITRCAIAGLKQFASSFKTELFLEAHRIEEQTGSYDAYLAQRAKTKPLLDIVEAEVKAAQAKISNILSNQNALKKVHQFSKKLNWALIIGSIFMPLIPMALAIAAIFHNCCKTHNSTQSDGKSNRLTDDKGLTGRGRYSLG